VDVDALCEALGARDPRRADAHQRTAAIKARDAVVDWPPQRAARRSVAHPLRPSDDRMRAYNTVGWPVVVVDPAGTSACAEPRRTAAEVDARGYPEWYEDPPHTQSAATEAARASRTW